MVEKDSIQRKKVIYDLQQFPRRCRAALDHERLSDVPPDQVNALIEYQRLLDEAKQGHPDPALVGEVQSSELERFLETIRRVRDGEWPEKDERFQLREFFRGRLLHLREQCRAH